MQLKDILTRYVALLGNSPAPEGKHWRKKLSAQIGAAQSNPRVAAKNILGFYGGMGSLSDVWFSDQEQDRQSETLRTELYNCCKALVE
jgi:hypothetical protein